MQHKILMRFVDLDNVFHKSHEVSITIHKKNQILLSDTTVKATRIPVIIKFIMHHVTYWLS